MKLESGSKEDATGSEMRSRHGYEVSGSITPGGKAQGGRSDKPEGAHMKSSVIEPDVNIFDFPRELGTGQFG